jgi:chromate transporter
VSQNVSASETREVIPFRSATRVWFSISLRTFGGPAGQIAVMHRELVDERRWIGEERFLHALSFCTLLPGPEAQQLAIYLGWLLNGTGGGVVAGTLFVLPGYVALMILSAIYVQWGATTAVTALLAGLAPAVLAIVAQAVIRISQRALRNPVLIGIAVASFSALFLANIAFPFVIAAAAAFGGLSGTFWRATTQFPPSAAQPRLDPVASVQVRGVEGKVSVTPLIADHALHGEQPSLRRAGRLLVVCGLLWAGPVVLSALTLGSSHLVVKQGLFFSGTAVVTFGGAYAVLAFVAQRAVNLFGWLSPGEMINGLALAETTPGPLIMVVQFVAFLGAFRNPGSLNPWVAALLGSTLTVWVTFVPCFLFVFLGAPHVERLRTNTRLASALSSVTAAVVGVMANLALYFAINVLFDRTRTYKDWPLSLSYPVVSSIDARAVIVAALAFVLVFILKWPVLKVLGTCAAIGAVLHLV